jgi:predicted translin family RNA/ssDNA-binding protein
LPTQQYAEARVFMAYLQEGRLPTSKELGELVQLEE